MRRTSSPEWTFRKYGLQIGVRWTNSAQSKFKFDNKVAINFRSSCLKICTPPPSFKYMHSRPRSNRLFNSLIESSLQLLTLHTRSSSLDALQSAHTNEKKGGF